MTRLALLSCAFLVACGGNTQSQDPVYDFAGIDLYNLHVNDAGMVVDGGEPADLAGVDIAGAPSGPQFTVVSPTATSAHTSVALDVKVTDTKSTLTAGMITCSIRKTGDTTLTATPIANGFEVKANIVFATYNPVLDGDITIALSATDAAGVTATKEIALNVDDSGPAITMVTPAEGAFIGGTTHVVATVIDSGSGVNPNKVFATFTGDAQFQVQLIDQGMGVFAGDFDASLLGKSFIFPSMTITALDMLGNSSDVGWQLIADNTQPIMSLDPPDVRVWQLNAANAEECSAIFDPVGSDAINDPYNSPNLAQLLTIRARVEDQPNRATGQTVTYVSGLNANTIKLVAIPAPMSGDTPILAVDTDGDGVCDNINPKLSPVVAGQPAQTSDQYLSLVMNPVVGGAADYRPNAAGAPSDGCQAFGDPSDTTAPAGLCNAVTGSQLSYAITYTTMKSPALWTIGTVGADGSGNLNCAGQQFDTLNLLPEGWACFAVVASDTTGNHAISAPLRACIRRTTMANHPCDTQTTPPNCTGTYTTTGTLNSTACTPQTFAAEVVPD